jgi:hypothetical protein
MALMMLAMHHEDVRNAASEKSFREYFSLTHWIDLVSISSWGLLAPLTRLKLFWSADTSGRRSPAQTP